MKYLEMMYEGFDHITHGKSYEAHPITCVYEYGDFYVIDDRGSKIIVSLSDIGKIWREVEMNKFEELLIQWNEKERTVFEGDVMREALEIASKHYEGEKPKRWKPKEGDKCYFVELHDPEHGAYPSHWTNGKSNNLSFNQGLVFDNHKDAGDYGLRQQRINIAIQKMKDIAGDWRPNWSDEYQAKYYVAYAHYTNMIRTYHSALEQKSTLPHFPTEELAQKAIDEIEDLKLVFGVSDE